MLYWCMYFHDDIHVSWEADLGEPHIAELFVEQAIFNLGEHGHIFEISLDSGSFWWHKSEWSSNLYIQSSLGPRKVIGGTQDRTLAFW